MVNDASFSEEEKTGIIIKLSRKTEICEGVLKGEGFTLAFTASDSVLVDKLFKLQNSECLVKYHRRRFKPYWDHSVNCFVFDVVQTGKE